MAAVETDMDDGAGRTEVCVCAVRHYFGLPVQCSELVTMLRRLEGLLMLLCRSSTSTC